MININLLMFTKPYQLATAVINLISYVDAPRILPKVMKHVLMVPLANKH